MLRSIAQSFEALQASYLGSIRALNHALDSRDQYTAGHAADVESLAVALGLDAGLGEEDLQALSLGALFHDIGKIGIPDGVLNKAGPLDPVERALMERHPEIGERILAPLGIMGPLLPIVRHEHERWDGKGYPDGLAGVEIPIGARIIFVCDAYNAMTTDRPYRAALSQGEALSRLRSAAGTQFDPDLVEAFVERVLPARRGVPATAEPASPSSVTPLRRPSREALVGGSPSR